MSTLLTASRPVVGQSSLLGESDDLGGATDREPAGDRAGKPRSLDDLIVDTWEGLVSGTSQCPVCGGRMEPQYGTHARPIGGRCADCGSALH